MFKIKTSVDKMIIFFVLIVGINFITSADDFSYFLLSKQENKNREKVLVAQLIRDSLWVNGVKSTQVDLKNRFKETDTKVLPEELLLTILK